MEKLTVICIIVAVASTTLALPNSAYAYQGQARTSPDGGQNAFGNRSIGQRAVENENRRTYKDVHARLTALRAQLAAGWQAMGMPKESAEQVAAAYPPNGREPTHHVSVLGKSDAEVATMLQSALAEKDFNRANETLLAFQRKKLEDQGRVSADDKK